MDEEKDKTSFFIALAIVIVILILGYWYLSRMPSPPSPKQAPITPQAPPQSATPPANDSPVSPPTIKSNQLQSTTLQQGTGESAKTGDTVTVNYTGTFTDGKIFDSSIPRGKPFVFKLGAGQVITGWDQGLVGMKVGEKRKLVIPPALAYGERGAGDGAIPPNSTLIFEVEMLKIN